MLLVNANDRLKRRRNLLDLEEENFLPEQLGGWSNIN